MYHCFHKNIKYYTTVLNLMKNVSWAANLHIRMISEGSREVMKIAENSALPLLE